MEMYAIVMWLVHTVLSIIPQSSEIRHGNKVTNQEDLLVEYEGTIVVVLKMVQKGMLWVLPFAVIGIILTITGNDSETDRNLSYMVCIFYSIMLIIITLYSRKYENTYFIFRESELLWCYGYGKRIVPYEEIKQQMQRRYFKVNNTYIIPIKHTSIRIKSEQASGIEAGMKKMKQWGIPVPNPTELQEKRFQQINILKLCVAFSIMGWCVGIGFDLYCGSVLNSGQLVLNWLLPGFALVCLIIFLVLNQILTVRAKLSTH
jgi:hypothetical protein